MSKNSGETPSKTRSGTHENKLTHSEHANEEVKGKLSQGHASSCPKRARCRHRLTRAWALWEPGQKKHLGQSVATPSGTTPEAHARHPLGDTGGVRAPDPLQTPAVVS